MFNMDETSIYLDMPANYTYDKKGKKRIEIDTAGAERVRLSTAFTAAADGTKLPIFVIIPRAHAMDGYVPPANVRILYRTQARFSSDVIVNAYLPEIMANHPGSCLLLDSARCHTTDRVRTAMDDLNIARALIPPSLTNLLQPADVCWFSSVKREYRAKWNHWFRSVN